MQHTRRTNPYPWTWELPAVVATITLLIMIFAVHVGRAIANLMAGGGWQLTPRSGLFWALPRILGGDTTAGLNSPPAELADPGHMWIWIILTELAVLVGAAIAIRALMTRWGPGRIHGMATAAEAEQLLGLSRLRRNAAIIRPDLYGK